MEEEKFFDTIDAMFDYIVKDWQEFGNDMFSKEDLSIEEKPGKDKRINWKESREVYVKRMGKKCTQRHSVLDIVALKTLMYKSN